MRNLSGADRPRVVLAEDDDEMRRLVSRSLRNEGFRVDEAANGSELLEQLENASSAGDKVDVVITDIRMPGLSGFQALDWLQQVRALRPPTIVITAFPDALTYVRASQLGVQVLEKPFDLDDLRSLVRTLSGFGSRSGRGSSPGRRRPTHRPIPR